MTPVCAGCGAPAERELLQVPSGEPFPEPIYSCRHGARAYGWHYTRTPRSGGSSAGMVPTETADRTVPPSAVSAWSEGELRAAWGDK